MENLISNPQEANKTTAATGVTVGRTGESEYNFRNEVS